MTGTRAASGHKAMYLVLLEFPEEKEDEPTFSWLQGFRQKVEQFCGECCFKIGKFYILPEPYFSVLDNFLRKAERDYRRKGYSPLFKILKTSLYWTEYVSLRKLIVDRLFAKLENHLKGWDQKKPLKELNLSGEVQKASKDLIKATEFVLLFQLDKAFPGRMNRLYDLIDILGERIAEHKACPLDPVVVTLVES